MYIQFINFSLKDMSHQEFETLCDQLAPAYAGIPGLLSKVWLSNRETNTYGGVYTFEDKAAWEAYRQSDFFSNVANHPNFTNIIARDFAILVGPTEVTRGLVRSAAD